MNIYEMLDNDLGESRYEQERFLMQIRLSQRVILVRSALVGLASGLLIGLVAAHLITTYGTYQPALRTFLLGIVALALFGTYLGFVYGLQLAERMWMPLATNELAVRNRNNRLR